MSSWFALAAQWMGRRPSSSFLLLSLGSTCFVKSALLVRHCKLMGDHLVDRYI